MVLIGANNYVFLGVLGFVAMIWILSSMGIVKSRDHELYVAKQRHAHQAMNNIDRAYSYMENLPTHARAKIIEHLDNGMLNHAVETAKAHHDVYHFFKNFS
jgi:hypothetical protein